MHPLKTNMSKIKEEDKTKYSKVKSLGVDEKLLPSRNYIHDKSTNVTGNVSRFVHVSKETMEKNNTQFKVYNLIKIDESATQGVNDTFPKTLHTELLPDAQQFKSSISETIVLHLNKTESDSGNGFSNVLREASERELPSSVARQNSFNSCITSVKEKIGSSSGTLDNVQLFLHALMSFAEKAYPQVVQQLNECKSEEISFTFTCDLKSDDVKPSAPQLNHEPSIHTCTTVVDPDLLPKSLDTDFLKFKLSPFNKQIHLKLSLDTFLENVLSLLPIVNEMFSESAIKVPTLHFANWHFRNIAQGYLLRFVLNKSNVNTLNIMRNLYFIIITTNTVNLFLEVNFNFKNDIFTLEDIRPVNDFCEETSSPESISLSSFGTDTFINDMSAFGPDIYKVEQNTSIFTESDGEDTLSAFDSIFSTATSRCTIVTGKRCVATSTIFCFQFPQTPKQTIDIGAGDEPAFSVPEKPKPKNWIFKPWLANKYIIPTHHDIELSLNYFDESIFERLSNLHSKCTSPEFRKVFLKCLGHTLGCTLISLFISLL